VAGGVQGRARRLSVPTGWAEDPSLGTWVENHWRCKKALDRGGPSQRMTVAWVARLDALGFTWDTVEARWEAQFAKLQNYKRKRGDCNVPLAWAEDLGLGGWVHNQWT
jgi:hypothetical protein